MNSQHPANERKEFMHALKEEKKAATQSADSNTQASQTKEEVQNLASARLVTRRLNEQSPTSVVDLVETHSNEQPQPTQDQVKTMVKIFESQVQRNLEERLNKLQYDLDIQLAIERLQKELKVQFNYELAKKIVENFDDPELKITIEEKLNQTTAIGVLTNALARQMAQDCPQEEKASLVALMDEILKGLPEGLKNLEKKKVQREKETAAAEEAEDRIYDTYPQSDIDGHNISREFTHDDIYPEQHILTQDNVQRKEPNHIKAPYEIYEIMRSHFQKELENFMQHYHGKIVGEKAKELLDQDLFGQLAKIETDQVYDLKEEFSGNPSDKPAVQPNISEELGTPSIAETYLQETNFSAHNPTRPESDKYADDVTKNGKLLGTEHGSHIVETAMNNTGPGRNRVPKSIDDIKVRHHEQRKDNHSKTLYSKDDLNIKKNKEQVMARRNRKKNK